MFRCFNRKLGLAFVAVLVTAVIAMAIVGHFGKQIASPTRRTLQDYHLDYLQDPTRHGIRIENMTCLGGRVPCLIIWPDPDAELGGRGELIRRQVTTLGHELKPNGEILGNLVLLHGRTGRKEDLLPAAERFCAVGFRCIIPDLPAHGDSPIDASHFGLSEWERQMPADLLAECADQFDFAAAPCALWGISMGGSFATSAASASGDWDCIVIVSSFDQLHPVVAAQCGSGLLANLVGNANERHGGPEIAKVVPSEWAKSVEIPVLVAHGTDDRVISLESGRSLFESFSSEHKQWLDVEGGTHGNVLTTPMPLYARMADWFLMHSSSSSLNAGRKAE